MLILASADTYALRKRSGVSVVKSFADTVEQSAVVTAGCFLIALESTAWRLAKLTELNVTWTSTIV